MILQISHPPKNKIIISLLNLLHSIFITSSPHSLIPHISHSIILIATITKKSSIDDTRKNMWILTVVVFCALTSWKTLWSANIKVILSSLFVLFPSNCSSRRYIADQASPAILVSLSSLTDVYNSVLSIPNFRKPLICSVWGGQPVWFEQCLLKIFLRPRKPKEKKGEMDPRDDVSSWFFEGLKKTGILIPVGATEDTKLFAIFQIP